MVNIYQDINQNPNKNEGQYSGLNQVPPQQRSRTGTSFVQQPRINLNTLIIFD